MLELAIWKSKITAHYGQIEGHLTTNSKKERRTDSVSRTQIRTDSVTMVMIIVPTVFSFLTDSSGVNNIVGDIDDNDGDNFDYNDIDDTDESDDSGDEDAL